MAPKQFTIDNNSEQAVKERLETLVACGDNLVKYLQSKQSDSSEHELFLNWRAIHNNTVPGYETQQVSHHYEQIRMSPCEHRDVHRYVDGVGLI